MASPYDDLLMSDSEAGKVAASYYTDQPRPSETTADTEKRTEMEAANTARIQVRKGKELASRGQVPYTDTQGIVQPVTDTTGAPLTKFDRKNQIGYDSTGNPQKVEMDEFGNPSLSDPFAGLAPTLDEKTGEKYLIAPGLPWRWAGTDAQQKKKVEFAAEDKMLGRASAMLGRKLSLTEHDLNLSEKERTASAKALRGMGYDVEGMDEETLTQAISTAFDAQKSEGDAAKTDGFFGLGGNLTPEALAAQTEIERSKQTALGHAQKYFSHTGRINKIHGDAEAVVAQRMAIENERLAREQELLQAEGMGDLLGAPQTDATQPLPATQPVQQTAPVEEAPMTAAPQPTEDGGTLKDLALSFGSGANSLVKMAGDLYGLFTGDVNNAVSKFGKEGMEWYEQRKSTAFKKAAEEREKAIAAAPDDIGKAWEFVKATLADPKLVGSLVFENIPNAVGTGGVGVAVKIAAAKTLLRNAATEAAAKIAAKQAATIGTRTAIGTGAALQGADVGGDQYNDFITRLEAMPAAEAAQIPEIADLMERGSTLDEAKLALALTQARKTGALASLVSLVSQKVSGGQTIERAIVGGVNNAGKGLASRIVRGAVGESGQEMIEEGGGLIGKNLLAQPVDPNRSAFEGIGVTLAQAGLAAGVLGGVAGISKGGQAEEPGAPTEPPTGEPPPAMPKNGTISAPGMLSRGRKHLDLLDAEILKESDDGTKMMPDGKGGFVPEPMTADRFVDERKIAKLQAERDELAGFLEAEDAESIAGLYGYEIGAAGSAAAPTPPTPAGKAPPAANEPETIFTKNGRTIVEALKKANSPLLEQVTELHAQDKTAGEIAQELGLDAPTVRAIRIGLNLPSQGRAAGILGGGGVGFDDDVRPEFEKWAAERKAQKKPPVEQPPIIDPAELQRQMQQGQAAGLTGIEADDSATVVEGEGDAFAAIQPKAAPKAEQAAPEPTEAVAGNERDASKPDEAFPPPAWLRANEKKAWQSAQQAIATIKDYAPKEAGGSSKSRRKAIEKADIALRRAAEVLGIKPDRGRSTFYQPESDLKTAMHIESEMNEIAPVEIGKEAKPKKQASAAAKPESKPAAAVVVRDASKPEQMTPEEAEALQFKLPKGTVADILPSMEQMKGKTSVQSRTGRQGSKFEHAIATATASRNLLPVSAAAVDAYGIKLPDGYVKRGELYVFEGKAEPTAGAGEKAVAEKPARAGIAPRIQKAVQSHAAELKALGHAVRAHIGKLPLPNKSGLAVHNGKITLDHDQFEADTRHMNEAQLNAYIDQAVAHEVLHLGFLKYANESEANMDRALNLPKNEPAAVEYLQENYPGYDKLNDFQKAAEVARVIMEGKTGVTTESSWQFIKDLLESIKRILTNMTEATRKVIAEIEARMSQKPEAKPKTKAEPQNEGIRKGDWIQWKDEYGKMRSGKVDSIWKVGRIIPGQTSIPRVEYSVVDGKGDSVGTARDSQSPEKIEPPKAEKAPEEKPVAKPEAEKPKLSSHAQILKDELGGLFSAAPTSSAPFFSQLTKVVQGLPQLQMTVQQARAAIEKGAKKDEIAMSGILTDPLSPLFDKQEGDKVTRNELVGYAMERQATVQDVVLGEATSTRPQWQLWDKGRNEVIAAGDDVAKARWERDLRPHQEIRQMQVPVDGTKFSNYQLPGADEGSYREMFVTWPREQMAPGFEVFEARPGSGNWSVRFPNGQALGTWLSREAAIKSQRNQPQSGHWNDGHSQFSDIQNPIVRIRRNIRHFTADGTSYTPPQRMYFIEELQGPSKSEQEKMPPELRKRIYEIGMKRAIRDAVSEGVDALAWTTGEQQAGRYDLSKQVDSIIWSDGFYADAPAAKVVTVKIKGEDRHLALTLAPDGRVEKVGLSGRGKEFIGRSVEDVVGKEIAARILAEKDGNLSGEGLKVGGEGLRRLYDETLPRIANKLMEKFGVKVAQADIGTSKLKDVGVEIYEGEAWTPLDGEFLNEAQAVDAGEATGKRYRLTENNNAELVKVHTIQIPEAARQQIAEQGFTLYAGETSPTYTASIPPEMRDALNRVASKLVDDGCDTPEKLATALSELGPKAKAFSQKIWFKLLGENATGTAEPDWSAIYGKMEKPAAEQETESVLAVEPPKAVVEAAEKQAEKPDTSPKKLKVQKEYLIAALDTAHAEATQDRTPTWVSDEAEVDYKTASDWNRYDNPISKDRPRTPDRYGKTDEELKAAQDEHEILESAWQEKLRVHLQPLFDKYKVAEIEPEYSGYLTLDGTISQARPERKFLPSEMAVELQSEIKAKNEAARPRIKIEVPGDGTFEIVNTKQAIGEFRKIVAKRFPVGTPKPEEAKPTALKASTIPPILKPKLPIDYVKAAAIATSDDATRAILANVMTDGKHVVASDGRRMIVLTQKAAGSKDSRKLWHKDSFKPKDEKDVGNFPNWNQVVPQGFKEVHTVDTGDFYKALKAADAITSERSNSVLFVENPDGSIGFKANTPDVGEYEGNVQDGNKILLAVNPEFAMDAMKAARMLGHEKVDIQTVDDMSPVVFAAPNFKYILMSMRISAGNFLDQPLGKKLANTETPVQNNTASNSNETPRNTQTQERPELQAIAQGSDQSPADAGASGEGSKGDGGLHEAASAKIGLVKRLVAQQSDDWKSIGIETRERGEGEEHGIAWLDTGDLSIVTDSERLAKSGALVEQEGGSAANYIRAVLNEEEAHWRDAIAGIAGNDSFTERQKRLVEDAPKNVIAELKSIYPSADGDIQLGAELMRVLYQRVTGAPITEETIPWLKPSALNRALEAWDIPVWVLQHLENMEAVNADTAALALPRWKGEAHILHAAPTTPESGDEENTTEDAGSKPENTSPGRIDSVFRRIISGGRWFWEGTADVLERAGYKKLADAIKHQHEVEAREFGETWKPMRDVLQKHSKADIAKGKEEWTDYYQNRENKRDTYAEEQLETYSEAGKELIAAWKKIAAETGIRLTKLGVEVKTPSGAWRPIGNLGEKFFPRKINQATVKVLQEPEKYPEQWQALVNDLIENGNIEKESEAEAFLKEHVWHEDVKSDYFANIERARTGKLPESWLEYKFDEIAPWYAAHYARRVGQIEAYGQEHKEGGDLFDKTLADIPKRKPWSATQEYIETAKDAAYMRRDNTGLAQGLRNLQTLATGTFLTNPFSAIRNVVGGVAQTSVLFGPVNTLKAAWKTLLHAREALGRTHDLGVMRDDMMQMMVETRLIDETTGAQFLRKAANLGLTYSGFNMAERFARSVAMMTASDFARTYRTATGEKKNQMRAFLIRHEADPAKIEAGDKEAVNTFVRNSVNQGQGSYKFSQTPLYFSDPKVAFLMQFGKWGTQMTRTLVKHAINPAVFGTNVDGKNVRTYYPLLLALAMAVGGGELLYLIRELFTDRDRPDASLDEIGNALKQNKREGIEQIANRIFGDVIMGGTLGMLGDYAGNLREFATKNRFKNPFDPPGVQVLKNAFTVLATLKQQRTLTARDIKDVFETQFSGARFMEQTARNITGDKWQKALQTQTEARQAGMRMAKELGLSVQAPFSSTAPVKTPKTPFYTAINDALLTGDVEGARKARAEFIKSLPLKDRGKASDSLATSVSQHQPIKVGGIAGAKQREQFIAWARKRLPHDQFSRIMKLDAIYWRTARQSGVIARVPVANTKAVHLDNYASKGSARELTSFY